jgi:hypothetical protein
MPGPSTTSSGAESPVTAVLLRPKRGLQGWKNEEIMAVADRSGLPVAVYIESATPHEVKLVESTLVQMVVPEAPQNLNGDNAYDSDKLKVDTTR